MIHDGYEQFWQGMGYFYLHLGVMGLGFVGVAVRQDRRSRYIPDTPQHEHGVYHVLVH